MRQYGQWAMSRLVILANLDDYLPATIDNFDNDHKPSVVMWLCFGTTAMPPTAIQTHVYQCLFAPLPIWHVVCHHWSRIYSSAVAIVVVAMVIVLQMLVNLSHHHAPSYL